MKAFSLTIFFICNKNGSDNSDDNNTVIMIALITITMITIIESVIIFISNV